MHNSLWILLVSTLSVAFLHALAPDHWMPFAAIGKAQRWSKARLLLITFISGIGHVGISIVFSITGILLGFSLSKLKGIEGQRGEVVLWLLIGFGIAYMIWGIKKAREQKRKVIDEEKLKAETVAVWTMFAVIVLGPCEPLVPLAFLGYNYGWDRSYNRKYYFFYSYNNHDACAESPGVYGYTVNKKRYSGKILPCLCRFSYCLNRCICHVGRNLTPL